MRVLAYGVKRCSSVTATINRVRSLRATIAVQIGVTIVVTS